jgi:capsid protein
MTEDENGLEKLQVIEAHRIATGGVSDPQCIDGIWVDKYRRRAGFNVRIPSDPTLPLTDATKRIAPRDFIYMAERNRPDEVRSITNFVHALAPLQDLYEIIAFAMTSAKKNSEIAAIIETDTPGDLPLGTPRGMVVKSAVAATSDQPAVPEVRLTYEQVYGGGGKIPILRPGEKFQSYAHVQPSPSIEAWSEFIIRGVAAGYGLPFEILWNPTTIGGANTRMVTALLRARLQQRRTSLIFPKLNRVRLWILARAIARGDLPFDPGLFKCEWQPKFIDITVDAGRESRERRANVLSGLDTFTSYDSENGNDYLGHSLPARELEIAAQCAAAARLVAQFPALNFDSALARIALLSGGGIEGILNQAPTVSGP